MTTKLQLGMPHLNYHGLDQVWLLKHLGDKHWSMLSKNPAVSTNNERLYASFFCCHVNFNKGQHCYSEFDTIEIDSKLFKFNNQIYRSVHDIYNSKNLTTVILESVFVKKNMITNKLIRDDPSNEMNKVDRIDKVFLEEHKRLKLEFKKSAVTKQLVKLQFNPETFFNSVKILYFANYLNLVAQCEFLFFPKLKESIKEITIYFFSNIEFSDTVYGVTHLENDIYTTTLVANDKVIAHAIIKR
jgi:probable biosynthetic protein (TIGR04098 family)